MEEEKAGGKHRRGVSETEFLLSQIRNNINTLKAYQPYAPSDDQPVELPQTQKDGDEYNFLNKPPPQ